MKSLSWPVITIIAGIGLMLVAPLLFSAAPSSTFWTEADQVTYQQASADLHAATQHLPEKKERRGKSKTDDAPYDPVAAKARFAAAKTAYDKQESRLQSARSRPAWVAWGLRLLGILVTGLGVYGHFTAQPPAKPAPRPLTLRSSQPPPQPRHTGQPLPPGYNEIVTMDGPPPRISE